jgi:hypothetical protein
MSLRNRRRNARFSQKPTNHCLRGGLMRYLIIKDKMRIWKEWRKLGSKERLSEWCWKGEFRVSKRKECLLVSLIWHLGRNQINSKLRLNALIKIQEVEAGKYFHLNPYLSIDLLSQWLINEWSQSIDQLLGRNRNLIWLLWIDQYPHHT